ncbi:putative phage abortive infection protein [Empedobacter brevis]|uniref:putative phage abortive infection protein n=1 Tax=Empedobacter brevis TaxID=247 RepID=UPI003A5C8174
MSIARAQLSSSEQILLFYNCIHENGREKFMPLIEKYTLFNNIDFSLLVNKKVRYLYSDKAFEKKN